MMKKILILSLIGIICSCKKKPSTNLKDGNLSEVEKEKNVKKEYLRKDVYTLASTDPIITGYQKAIKHMQSLPDSDPTSWSYQAAIHGTYDTANLPAWNQCQHGSFFFLSWHRMYLYYFERIIRKYSEDPNWALPYWNYSTPTTRSIPSVFRDNVTGNPLYISERNPAMNAGGKLESYVVSLDCLTKIPFTGAPISRENFGGQTIPAPAHFSGGTGALENIPHNQVHNSIGGWMRDPNTAALDPIFWLHHSNIDRLWNSWISLGNGRENTDNSIWLNTKFPFFDENGILVELTGAEILNTVTQLNYRYESDPVEIEETILLASNNTPKKESLNKKVFQGGSQEGKILIAETKEETVQFTHEPLHVNLSLKQEKRKLMQAFLVEDKSIQEEQKGTYLTVEGIKFDTMPNKSIGVFINVPNGEKPDYNSDHFVDLITFFGIGHHVHHGHKGGVNVVFKIDDELSKLKSKGIDISNIKITFDFTDGIESPEGFLKQEINKSVAPVGSPSFERITVSVF